MESKINLYTQYTRVADLFKYDLINNKAIPQALTKRVSDFEISLRVLTEYMIVKRFVPSKKKDKKKYKYSADSIRILNLRSEKPPIFPDAREVISFYKLLENFLLHRKYSKPFSEIRMECFSHTSLLIFNNLPKLLLSIEELDVDMRSKLLDFLFSSVSIYRQFKIKSKPDLSTVTNSYDGKQSLDVVLSEHFSPEKVESWVNCLI